jgi:hypothetical protein
MQFGAGQYISEHSALSMLKVEYFGASCLPKCTALNPEGR